MTYIDYATYIRSDAWQQRRRQALDWYGHRCEACGSHNHLHVHHRTYERIGHETMDDLRVLCEACHDLVHDTQRRQHRELTDATDLVTSTPAVPDDDGVVKVRDLFPVWLHLSNIRAKTEQASDGN